MDLETLQNNLEKIDFNELRKKNIKLSEDDAYVGELYNSAIDNIKQNNLDVAKIKLNRVVKLDPTFEKAAALLGKISEIQENKSLGDKMEEALYAKEEKEGKKHRLFNFNLTPKEQSTIRETPPRETSTLKAQKIYPASQNKAKLSPFTFMKIQMVIIIALVLIIIALLIFIFDMRIKFNTFVKDQPDLAGALETLEKEHNDLSLEYEAAVRGYQEKITEYEKQLDKKNLDQSKVDLIIDGLSAQRDLYLAKKLELEGEYKQAYNLLIDIDVINAGFSEEDQALYDACLKYTKMQLAISIYNSGNKLYQDLKYKEAYDNFKDIWDFYPTYNSVLDWKDEVEYTNLVYDSVFKMAKCAFEIKEYDQAVAGYGFVEKSNTEFSNMNMSGIIYHSAKAYAGLEDWDMAEKLFMRVIEEYPQSELVVHARNRLALVQENKK